MAPLGSKWIGNYTQKQRATITHFLKCRLSINQRFKWVKFFNSSRLSVPASQSTFAAQRMKVGYPRYLRPQPCTVIWCKIRAHDLMPL